jgi:glycosyltransferase involved in cell wall biosynthesis
VSHAIDINGRFLTQPVTGVQRFAEEIVRGLDRRLASSARLRGLYRFRLIAPRSARDFELEHIPLTRVGRGKGHSWEQLQLPLHAGRRLLLNLANTAPLTTRNLVTLHDAGVYAVPDSYSAAFRWWYRTLIPVLGRTAVRVVTVSRFSQSELTRRARIPQRKMELVPQGCEHVLRTEPDRRVFDRLPVLPRGYLLAVGSRSPHKNLALVAQALALLGEAAPPLVIAGAANTRVFGRELPLGSRRVHSAGYVTDAELRALYEGACGFIYPSRYEGFGIPPLEAMACGCPVIVARSAALPEACGDAALYCDPYDAEDLARKIRDLVGNPGLQSELRQRGSSRARDFTWERASNTLVEVLERASGS